MYVNSFLEKVIVDVNLKKADLKSMCFILPNKRSAAYFKQKLLEKIEKPTFSPEIYSIDSFIVQISGLSEVKHSEQVLILYELFLGLKKKKNTESFEEFNSWATSFIKDVSEIDQNLLNTQSILVELNEINKINNWGKKDSIDKEKSSFWELLPELYPLFKKKLIRNESGTKGICYKEAKENLEHYKEANKNLKHIFIGLNSLSKSEEIIIEELLAFNNGEIYWDIDKEFLINKSHGASFFIKKYKYNWDRFEKNTFKWEGQDYAKKKNIQILGTPKLIGQAKLVGQILSTLDKNKLKNTAVVLGDESIIEPVLNYTAKDFKELNITIKPRLDLMEIKSLISDIFDIQTIKEVENMLNFKKLSVLRLFRTTFPKYEELLKKEKETILAVFNEWKSPKAALLALRDFFNQALLKTKKHSNELAQIKYANNALLKSYELLERYSFVKDLNTLKSIILSQLDESSLSFKSNLNANTQFMGILESRAIDFENVIITSLNEGILPKGKTQSSLIPYDLRKKHGLLTYGERDAIYTYHFYRLIKRAKNVFLIYNNFNEGVLGGEKSRFIHQLEIEGKHNIVARNISPKVYPQDKELKLLKSPGSIARLTELAKTGFSPSSLESYLKNPTDFYFQKLLNVYENQEQDAISPRLVGLIFHDTLEAVYKPFLNKKINKKDLLFSLTQIKINMQESFLKNNIKDYNKGKGLILFEVVNKAIKRLIRNEIIDIELGNEIEIIALEKKIECELKFKKLKNNVKLRGVIDRLDKRNGIIRIIDYKTGLIKTNEVTVKTLSSSFDLSHLKAMQLLCYALMYFKNNPECNKLEAGLISFRDLNKGMIKFGIKESSAPPNHLINSAIIEEFEGLIKNLILEIMDPNHPFTDSV